MDMICNHIKNDLNITLDRKDINFTYKMKGKPGNKAPAPALVNFVSMVKRNEILQAARFIKKRET